MTPILKEYIIDYNGEIIGTDKRQSIQNVLICDDERHCLVHTDHCFLIIDFLANKVMVKYYTPLRISRMSFNKDLSQVIMSYGGLEMDFMLMSWDKHTNILKEVAIRRLIIGIFY